MKTKDPTVDTLYGRPVYQKPDGVLYQMEVIKVEKKKWTKKRT